MRETNHAKIIHKLLHRKVIYMTNNFMILEKQRPKLQKLKNLLETNFYLGQMAEENNDAVKV